MTVPNAFLALAALLRTVDPTPEPVPQFVFADPKEAATLNDFPCIVLALAPQTQHTWRAGGLGGLGRHDYVARLYIFLSDLAKPLAERHAMVLPWPQALATALFADQTLGGAVAFIGTGDSENRLFSYQPRPIPWGDSTYWGIVADLPITEMPTMSMS